MKVNLGCGGNKLDGWINYDSEVDISKPLPFENDSIDMILMEHCWEHIDPHSAVRCLDECRRVLKTGGVLRLCVPVLDELEGEHARDIIFGNGHQAAYSRTLVRSLLRIVGFKEITETIKRDCDGHWRVIGMEKDNLETARFEAVK